MLAIRKLLRAASLLGALVLLGCASEPTPPPRPRALPQPPPAAPAPPAPAPAGPLFNLEAVSFGALEGWRDGHPEKGLEAFRRSCTAMLNRAADAPLGGIGYAGKVTDWEDACRLASVTRTDSPDIARAFFERSFVPYRLTQPASEGLFTGYFEPELRGSRTRHGRYQTPLYGVPPDLVRRDMGVYRDTYIGRMADMIENLMMGAGMRFVPYPARADIEREGIPGPPLFYVDDPVDAFFLEIQGSGRVVMDDGTVVRAAYAAQNGQPYTPIGAILLERGQITREELSYQSIRQWLQTHPVEAREVMDFNASYVFFAEKPIGDPKLGAVGAQGVPLTPIASMAVDRSVHALGVPVWLESAAPDPSTFYGNKPFDTLLVTQDTGGAIRGVVRGDVYWGYGAEAGLMAGRMKQPGRMTVLLPHELADRLGARAAFQAPR